MELRAGSAAKAEVFHYILQCKERPVFARSVCIPLKEGANGILADLSLSEEGTAVTYLYATTIAKEVVAWRAAHSIVRDYLEQ
ncbi:hypothetical protein GCM10011515_08470 [Tsuneonella deserti]|uniref:Uncharacterized protein n=1 Tax=Tsuneonella deserti TaxID=2035528 RepID=A0ABQ1S3E4_9SPHN|nr:hypothetical protein GCM10011515_08470 [Tsuneonella deserti]